MSPVEHVTQYTCDRCGQTHARRSRADKMLPEFWLAVTTHGEPTTQRNAEANEWVLCPRCAGDLGQFMREKPAKEAE
jgi:ssDNA-binding Zn-finger/Zn-ribbon topoisomerase 1